MEEKHLLKEVPTVPRTFEYRVLMVDDDAVFCEVADQLFSRLGYTVRCAEDGFEALAMMKDALPDIIICDLNMPRMSGFELLAIVRRHSRKSQLLR
jgi:CheY-like chemotaxis protein